MFLPRQVQRKQPPKVLEAPKRKLEDTSSALTDEPSAKKSRQQPTNITVPSPDPEYYEQLVCAIELILSDYAHLDARSSVWLKQHQRTVDGNDGYIHLSALFQHACFAGLKPQPTQALLHTALSTYPSPILGTTADGYFVRRQPFSIIFRSDNDDTKQGNRWDNKTVYVEAHLSTLCAKPAKLVWWLKKHGQLKEKWLPVQHVEAPRPAHAWIVLSGNVEMEWEKGPQKWQSRWPQDWIVLTKAEHTRRTKEYLELLHSRRMAPSRPLDTIHSEVDAHLEQRSEDLRPYISASGGADTGSHASSETREMHTAQASTAPKKPKSSKKGKACRDITMVHLTNLPPTSSPATIESYIKLKSHAFLARSAGSDMKPDPPQNVRISSVEHREGATEAVVRLLDIEEAKVIVEALSGAAFQALERDGAASGTKESGDAEAKVDPKVKGKAEKWKKRKEEDRRRKEQEKRDILEKFADVHAVLLDSEQALEHRG